MRRPSCKKALDSQQKLPRGKVITALPPRNIYVVKLLANNRSRERLALRTSLDPGREMPMPTATYLNTSTLFLFFFLKGPNSLSK